MLTNRRIPPPSAKAWLSLVWAFVLAVVACGKASGDPGEEATGGGSEGGAETGGSGKGGSAGRDAGGSAGEISGGSAGQGGGESGDFAGFGGEAASGGEPSGGMGGSGETAPSFSVDVSIHRGEGTEGRLLVARASCGLCSGPQYMYSRCRRVSDDTSCECSGSCVQSMRVERDGEVIAEHDFPTDQVTGSLLVNDLFETEGNVLVLEGCPELLSAPVDVPEIPTVSDVELGCDSATQEVEVSWVITPSADRVSVSVGDLYMGIQCGRPGSARSQVFDYEGGDGYHAEVAAYALLGAERTPYGYLTVWAVGDGRSDDLSPTACDP